MKANFHSPESESLKLKIICNKDFYEWVKITYPAENKAWKNEFWKVVPVEPVSWRWHRSFWHSLDCFQAGKETPPQGMDFAKTFFK